jgi:hypothetical protein
MDTVLPMPGARKIKYWDVRAWTVFKWLIGLSGGL